MGEPALRTVGLSKRYGAVDALSRSTSRLPGRGPRLPGPNGAGKTTTIRLLLGLIRPTAGPGRDLRAGLPAPRPSQAHRRLGVRARRGEPVAVAHRRGDPAPARPRARARSTRRTAICWSSGSRSTRRRRCAPTRRATGRRCCSSRADDAGPDLLVLDEPTSGLDPLMEQAFRECVHEARGRGQTVFLSSHILSEVEALCDRVGDPAAPADSSRSARWRSCATCRRSRSRPSVRRTGARPDAAFPASPRSCRGQPDPLPGPRHGQPLLKVLVAAGVQAAQPRTLARGAVPCPLRPERGAVRGRVTSRRAAPGPTGCGWAAARRRWSQG